MKISHKRKVQQKLLKRLKLSDNSQASTIMVNKIAVKMEISSGLVTKRKVISEAKESVKKVSKVNSFILTPKQTQVLDIIRQHADGIGPKNIGLAGGQEETKAAAWATGALKKLTEEGLVARTQLGNKVIYKVC